MTTGEEGKIRVVETWWTHGSGLGVYYIHMTYKILCNSLGSISIYRLYHVPIAYIHAHQISYRSIFLHNAQKKKRLPLESSPSAQVVLRQSHQVFIAVQQVSGRDPEFSLPETNENSHVCWIKMELMRAHTAGDCFLYSTAGFVSYKTIQNIQTSSLSFPLSFTSTYIVKRHAVANLSMLCGRPVQNIQLPMPNSAEMSLGGAATCCHLNSILPSCGTRSMLSGGMYKSAYHVKVIQKTYDPWVISWYI